MRILRTALCALMALLVPVGALADVAVNGSGQAALIATDGREIVPAGVYSRIEPLKTGFWCATDAAGKCMLLDAGGEPVSGAQYDELRCVKRTLLYREGGVWGILSDDGTPLVAAKYTDIRVNGDGDYIALRNAVGTGSAQSVDFLDADGRETAVGVRVLYGLNDYSQGFMPVLFAKSGRYGYLDPQGIVAFEGRYLAAGEFRDGYAVVTTDEGTGMIDRTGRMVVPARFADILRVGDIALLTGKDGSVLVLRIGGEELLQVPGPAYIGAIGDHGIIRTAEKTLLIGADGAVAGEYPADVTIADGDGGHIIVQGGMWGEAETYLALPDGTMAGEKQQTIRPLNPGGEPWYAVGRFDAAPVTDKNGETIRYEWEASGLRFYLMDGAGNVREDAAYTLLNPAETDRFFAATETRCGIIDPQGNWLWTAPEGFLSNE